MWRLISTKDQRKYRIIENLYAADRPLTISELAKSIGSSARIIKYDLAEINETLRELTGAIVSSSEGVFLNLPSSVGMDYFQRKLYRISPSFLFLEKIFFDETMGYAEMKDYLYISDSSLRRLVQNVKLALQDYGLSLETQPFRVVGHEGLIRNFYTAYFSEKYTMEDWPFENVDQELMRRFLERCAQSYEIPEVAMRYHHYHFFFGVDMSRGLRGHPPPTSHQGNEQFRESIYHVFLKMMTATDELCPVYEMTLRRYFNEFVDWGIFMSVPYLHLRLEEDADLKRKIQQLQVGLETLRKMFDLPETDFHYLILQLHNAMESYRLCPPGFSPKRYLLFPTFNVGLNDIVKQKIPLFYQEAKQMLIQICHERELVLQKDDLDYLLYILLSWWENLAFDFMEKFNSCRILVSSHLTLNHAKVITATLQTELSRHYTFEVLPGDCLTKENLEKMQFDLLIVTKTTTLEIEQPVLYMDGSAMHDRLRLLRQLTDEVVEKNKQKYFDKVKATCELLIK